MDCRFAIATKCFVRPFRSEPERSAPRDDKDLGGMLIRAMVDPALFVAA